MPSSQTAAVERRNDRTITHEPPKLKTTLKTPPKQATNPLQFVKVGPCSLYRTAQEQLQKVQEVKKVKQEVRDDPEDWQSNLDNWKSSRRKRQEHIIERVVEVKKLELEEHDRQRRRSKTFSEMMVERGNRGRKLSMSLAMYHEEDSNDLSDLGIGTSSGGKNPVIETTNADRDRLESHILEPAIAAASYSNKLTPTFHRSLDSLEIVATSSESDTFKRRVQSLEELDRDCRRQQALNPPPPPPPPPPPRVKVESAIIPEGRTTGESTGTTGKLLTNKPHTQLKPSKIPIPQSRSSESKELEEVVACSAEMLAGMTFPLGPPSSVEPPKEKPPPPPTDLSDEENHIIEPLKRLNSTRRIKKELRTRRSDFLGIEGVYNDDDDLELNLTKPPDMAAILAEERRIEQLHRRSYDTDSSHERDSGVELGPFGASVTSSEEDEITKKEREIIEVLEREEQWRHYGNEREQNSDIGEKLAHKLRELEDDDYVSGDVLRVERELLQLEQEELKRQRYNMAKQQQLIQRRKNDAPQNLANYQHWLIQEAEQRRINEKHQRSSCTPRKPSLPESIIQTLTQRMHNRASTSAQRAEHTQEKMLSVSGKKKCSHCSDELGRGAAMIIESLRLFYHMECFKCCVCHVRLGDGLMGTDVRVRNHKLHCHNCYSSDDGVKFSCV